LKRILVISLAGIGDTLMATPLIRELRRNFPEAQLDALVMWPGARSLLEDNPNLDTIHQHSFIKASKLASVRFVFGLRRRGYDTSINVHPQGRQEYRIIARLIGARRRLSHTYEITNWLDPHLVTDTIPQDYSVHAAENNARFLPLLGAVNSGSPREYELFLTSTETAWADQYVAKQQLTGRRWLGIHVGSGGTKNLALRRWPRASFATLAARLQAEVPGLPVIFFGGPDERADHAELFQQVRGGRVLFPEFPSLRHAAALLSQAHAFLSVDTVFMHLAAAVRVPRQFVIETPTVNPCILPLRADWTLIPNPGVGGRNLDFYRYDGRPIAGTPAEIQKIMQSVTVESVAAAVRPALI